MSSWYEALDTVEEILTRPVEEGFPLPEGLFEGLGAVPPALAARAQKAASDISERIIATEAVSRATLAELEWTRDRMEDLPSSGVSPAYLDITA